jgi:hypothetical protein
MVLSNIEKIINLIYIDLIIQFNSHILTSSLNSPEANYKVRTSTQKQQNVYKQNTK